MPEDSAVRKAALEWLRFAEEDLRYAQTGLESQHLSAAIACFHAQQSAEKAIKAVLISEGAEAPRIHDLSRLVELLPQDKVAGLPNSIGWLSPFAVANRYPGDDEQPGRSQLSQAVATASEVLKWSNMIMNNVQ